MCLIDRDVPEAGPVGDARSARHPSPLLAGTPWWPAPVSRFLPA